MHTDPESLKQLLCIDDHATIFDYLSRGLRPSGYEIAETTRWAEARKLLESGWLRPVLILVDPISTNGQACSIAEICEVAGAVPVVVISSSRDPRRLTEFLQQGARDFLCKPFSFRELTQTLEKVLASDIVPAAGKRDSEGVTFVCESRATEEAKKMALQVARSGVPVLIMGETGVGKDVIARFIHENSPMADSPFVKVNCAAMPTELVESELFGYRKGAFTGAYIDRPGKFEFANNGTIFLDEIAELTPGVQAKLLQVLQDGQFSRLGSNEEIQVAVRVLAATNRNLEQEIKEGKFREDLYYRLNVVNINLSPLRHRREEIPHFCSYFLQKFAEQYESDVKEIPESLLKVFLSYDWPGNVRELENIVKRFAVLKNPDAIAHDLTSRMAKRSENRLDELAERYLSETGDSDLDLKEVARKAVSQVEESVIRRTLQQTGWNKSEAARELKVSYKTLLTKIELYGIERE